MAWTDPNQKKEYMVRWRQDHPEHRRIHWLNRFHLSVSRYEEMVAAQDNKCAICLQEMDRPCIDHDHSCCEGRTSCGKCIRRLLCVKCNAALGGFQDDINILERAIAYLRSFQEN